MYNLTANQKLILDFLKNYYLENGISPTMQEVAKHFDKSISTIQGYFNELEKKGAISKDAHKSRSILINDLDNAGTEKLVVSGTISAGDGISVFEENDEYISVPANWIIGSNNDYYVLKVSGFSMYEDGILDGDYIAIRKQSYANNGDIIVAIIHSNFDQEKATLKRLYDDNSDKVTLKPSNPDLENIIVNRENLEIRGKFIGLIRNSQ